jgi:HlyD family secretion protein
LFLGTAPSLPFIKVNIYVSARGIIKPKEELIPLRINQLGQVTYSLLSPNQQVNKGDNLLQLAHPVLDEKKALNQ